MASYADLGIDKDYDLPEVGLPESGFDGGTRVRNYTAPRSPQPHVPAPAPGSSLGLDPSVGLGLGSAPQPAAAIPPPATPTPAPPPATPTPPPPVVTPPTPPATTPGYTPTLTSSDQALKDLDQTAFRAITAEDLNAIQKYMDAKGIEVSKDWRSRINADLHGWIRDNWKVTGLGAYAYNLFKTGMMTPKDTQGELDALRQTQYDAALERLGQASAYGGRGQEEELLAALSSRGLLDSGIAGQELERFRSEKFAIMSQAAARLNEIMYSNAAEDIRSEAMLRLQAELARANQEAYLRLKASLEQQAQDRQSGNGFLNFAGDVIGGVGGFLLGGPPGAAAGLSAANAIEGSSGSIGGTDFTDDANDLYGMEQSVYS